MFRKSLVFTAAALAAGLSFAVTSEQALAKDDKAKIEYKVKAKEKGSKLDYKFKAKGDGSKVDYKLKTKDGGTKVDYKAKSEDGKIDYKAKEKVKDGEYSYSEKLKVKGDYVVIDDPRVYDLDPAYTYARRDETIVRIDPDTRAVLDTIGGIAELSN